MLLSQKIFNSASNNLLIIFGVALAWCAAWYLNDYLFHFAQLSAVSSAIFMPAALRIICVLLFGWAGVLGLLTGSWYIASQFNDSILEALLLASLSSFPAMLVVTGSLYFLKINRDLSNLQPKHFLILGVASSACDVAAHIIYFVSTKLDVIDNALTMFTGDIVGTYLVFLIINVVLKIRAAF